MLLMGAIHKRHLIDDFGAAVMLEPTAWKLKAPSDLYF